MRGFQLHAQRWCSLSGVLNADALAEHCARVSLSSIRFPSASTKLHPPVSFTSCFCAHTSEFFASKDMQCANDSAPRISVSFQNVKEKAPTWMQVEKKENALFV